MPQRHLAWLIIAPVAVLFTAIWSATAPLPEKDYQRLSSIVEVLAEIDKSYYRELTDEEKKKIVEGMIQGGLDKLDPYSEYFDEERLKQFNAENKGVFGGIGAYLGVDPKTGLLIIDTPMPDGPAIEAGLLAGDVILKIDGKDVIVGETDSARAAIKGEPGTKVTFTIGRGDKIFDVNITRAIIQIQAVKGWRRLEGDGKPWNFILDGDPKIAFIRLNEFSEKAHDETKAALKAADEAGAEAIILDMRGNGGGLLTMAEKVSDLFLADGVIVRTRDRFDLGKDTKAKNDGSVWESPAKRPMAVLVNRGSASATEIVAAALQDNGRAAIVGERTYGKGSVQRSILSPDEKTAIKITTQIWLTPKGKHIDRGVVLTAAEAKDANRNKDDYGVAPDAGLAVPMKEDEVIQSILYWGEVERGRNPADFKPLSPNGPKLDPKFRDPVVEKAKEHIEAELKRLKTAKLLDRSKPS